MARSKFMAEKLAALGGNRVIVPGAIKPWPWITDEDRLAVAEVLETDNLAEQQKLQIEKLSEEFCAYLGVKYCIPTNSGTAALHMCVAGLEIGPGDEVITTAHTYWASAAAILHHLAIPVFVDIDPRTYCMNPALLEERINEHTKAIMPVHIHGMPCEMDDILAIAKKHGLAVIEDCAQAHGSAYKGKMCGTLGDCAGFSMQASKNLTTGSQGGKFVTDHELIHHRAATLQYLGERVVPGHERESQEYNARGMGWMYRGEVFGQAFARSQLRRLDAMNDARIRNCHTLTGGLKELPGVHTPHEPEHVRSSYYNYVITLHPDEVGLDVPVIDFREKFMKALRAEGMSVGQWQRMPVPMQTVFQKREGFGKGYPWACPLAGHVNYDSADYPVAKEFIDAAVYVSGIGPPNDEALMAQFIEAVSKVMAQPEQIMEIDLSA